MDFTCECFTCAMRSLSSHTHYNFAANARVVESFFFEKGDGEKIIKRKTLLIVFYKESRLFVLWARNFLSNFTLHSD